MSLTIQFFCGSRASSSQKLTPFHPDFRVSREAAMDVNTEPSQSEQIVWDDPTAREERAKLADNLQWPGSPSQHSEPIVPPPPPTAENGPPLRDSMTDSELVEMGERSRAVQQPAEQLKANCNHCLFFQLLVMSSTNTWARDSHLRPRSHRVTSSRPKPPASPSPSQTLQSRLSRRLLHFCTHPDGRCTLSAAESFFLSLRRSTRARSSPPDFSCPPSALRNALITVTS